jgi:hypothetical protein
MNDSEAQRLEKQLNELKLKYEYENQETFAVNFGLFNDNVNLKATLKNTIKDYNVLLDDFNALSKRSNAQIELIQKLTDENFQLKEDKLKNVSKRVNKLISNASTTSIASNSLLNAALKVKKRNDINGFWSPRAQQLHISNRSLSRDLYDREGRPSRQKSKSPSSFKSVGFNDIQICDYNSSEKSLRLANKTNELIEIGAWKLVGSVDTNDLIEMTFKMNTVLWPQKDIKLWSSYSSRKKDNGLTDIIIPCLDAKDLNKYNSIWDYNFHLLEFTLFDTQNNVMSRKEFTAK